MKARANAALAHFRDRLEQRRSHVGRRLRLADSHRFEDRGSTSCADVLVSMVCRPDRRPVEKHVLAAFIVAARGHHVCVVSPGRYEPGMSALCHRLGWSYLATATADDALALNVCLHLHRDARVIVKVEDAMLLVPGSLARLAARLQALQRDGSVKPGVLAPLVPQDSACAIQMLRMLGLMPAFERRFGTAPPGESAARALDAAAAQWLWRRTVPLAETAARLSRQPEQLLVAPARLDPGMLAFARSLWEDMGYFPVHRRRLIAGLSTAGADAVALARHAALLSQPVVVTSKVVAGRVPPPAADQSREQVR